MPSRPLPAIDFVEDRAARHLLDVLPEVADRQLLRHVDRAVVGRLLADDHAEDGGLAGAVRADEADLLAGIELERRVDEEQLLAVLLADVGEGDHPDSVRLNQTPPALRIQVQRLYCANHPGGHPCTVAAFSDNGEWSELRAARIGRPGSLFWLQPVGGRGFHPDVAAHIHGQRRSDASPERRQDQYDAGIISAFRGGTVTVAAAELRVALFGRDRVGPYGLAGLAAGVSRPNVTDVFPNRITKEVRAPFFGGGIQGPIGDRVTLFADFRMMLVFGKEADDLSVVAPIRGGIAWHF